MTNTLAPRSTHSVVRAGTSLIALALLNGCVSPGARTATVVAPPVPSVNTYVYPAQGQTPEQLARDRYDCYVFSVQQTGVDPSRLSSPAEPVVVAPGPGAGTETGALGGAIIGSLVAGPRSAGWGLLVGGATGAIVGSAVDANVQAQVTQAQMRVDNARVAVAQRTEEFRRVDNDCLTARGYSVT